MTANEESISELRKLFFDKVKQEHEKAGNSFHENDIERIENNDSWLARFINHHEGDMKEALTMLWDTCEWRKCMKVNEISEHNTCIEYLSDGSLFPYGCDKDDKMMLVFKCKMHVKGQKNFDELKRCLIYWFERLERQTNGDQITIFFDMMETGLSNMDMEFTKYLISLNKLYYPSFVNYILIYEMPWVLNAAFRIIKSWLPARAVQKIKFINRSSIKEFVNPQRMLLDWGGDDDFTYKFSPEVRIKLRNFSGNTSSNKSEDYRKKTVHFALNHSSAECSPVSAAYREMRSDSPSTTTLIRVIHPDTVHFNWNGSEFVGSINVENISNQNVLYKIKTTSPDRFRVRPNSGLLQQGVSTKITVVLQNGYQVLSILKDKFLIMSMSSDREEISQQEVTELWKSDHARIEQHRLKCFVAEPPQVDAPANSNVTSFNLSDNLVSKVEHLKHMTYEICECNKKLHKDLSYRQHVIMVILILLVLCVLMLIFLVYQNPSSNLSKTYTPSTCPAPF